MIEIDNKHYFTLVQNPNFSHKHNPQFLKDFGNVYRNNIHLSPFFRDIRAFADNPETSEIIIIKKGEFNNGNCRLYKVISYKAR